MKSRSQQISLGNQFLSLDFIEISLKSLRCAQCFSIGFVGCRRSSCHTCRFVRFTFCLDYVSWLFFVVLLFILHGATHFCEKFGGSWPEAGREHFDNMYGGKLDFKHVYARKCIE